MRSRADHGNPVGVPECLTARPPLPNYGSRAPTGSRTQTWRILRRDEPPPRTSGNALPRRAYCLQGCPLSVAAMTPVRVRIAPGRRVRAATRFEQDVPHVFDGAGGERLLVPLA